MGRVVVLGSLNVDLVTRVRQLPRPGETVSGGDLRRNPGGKGANQAVAAARAGAEVRMIGACGADDGGDVVLGALGRDGVDVSHVRRIADVPTGTATILVEDTGENVIAIGPGANGRLEPEDADVAVGLLRDGDVLLLQLEVPVVVSRRAARRARALGATVVLNAAPVDGPLDGLLDEVSVLVVNEQEAAALAAGAPGSAADHARLLSARHDAVVAVTLGSEGALVVDGGVEEEFPAPDVRVRDTVGAGDTFTGYLAAALADGTDRPLAVRRAVVAASLAVTGAGAQAAIPLADDVDTILTGEKEDHATRTRQ